MGAVDMLTDPRSAPRQPISDSVQADPLVEAIAKIARHMCRTTHWRKGPKHPSHVKAPLSYEQLEAHVNGGAPVGLAPITPGTSTTRIALLDFDSHKGEAGWDEMIATVRPVMRALESRGMSPFAFRSGGGRGVHVYLLWDEEQDAYSVQQLLEAVLAECGLKHGTKGVKAGEVERFPKSPSVEPGNYGSMWILPLAGESLPLDSETLELRPVEVVEAMRAWPKSKPVPVLDPPAVQTHGMPASLPTNLADLRSALAAIPNEGAHELDYDSWFRIVAGIHHATGGSVEGLALAHEFSRRASKYDADFLDERVWQYLKTNRAGGAITERTVYAQAAKHGWVEPVLDDFADLDAPPPISPSEVKAAPPDEHGFRDLDAGSQGSGPIVPNPGTTQPARFRAIPDEEFVAQAPPSWIIKGWLPRADIGFIIGESGSGKSFLMLEQAVAIA